MRTVKSIAPEYFADVRQMLTETRDTWNVILKQDSADLHRLDERHIEEIVDKDLWGQIPTLIATKGRPSLPVNYRQYLEANTEDLFLFRYDDDCLILVVNPDEDLARRFPLGDASWYYSR